MRHFGFSTGAIARDNVLLALECLNGTECEAIEVSALRMRELRPVIETLTYVDTRRYRHRSFHAPSRFAPSDEGAVLAQMVGLSERGWRIVVHPDSLHTPSLWNRLGAALLVENMDIRKPIGQMADDFDTIFSALPEAGLCLDLAHVRQVDPSMLQAYRLIRRHRSRIREVHLSDLNSRSEHVPLNVPALEAFREIVAYIPRNAPIILETPVECSEVPLQLGLAKLLFFWADIEYARRAGERWIQSFDAEAPQGRFIKYVEEFVSTVPGIHERAVSAVNQFVATAPSWFGGGRLEIQHEAQNPEADVTYRFVSERTQRRGGLPLIGPVAPRRFVESA